MNDAEIDAAAERLAWERELVAQKLELEALRPVSPHVPNRISPAERMRVIEAAYAEDGDALTPENGNENHVSGTGVPDASRPQNHPAAPLKWERKKFDPDKLRDAAADAQWRPNER